MSQSVQTTFLQSIALTIGNRCNAENYVLYEMSLPVWVGLDIGHLSALQTSVKIDQFAARSPKAFSTSARHVLCVRNTLPENGPRTQGINTLCPSDFGILMRAVARRETIHQADSFFDLW